MATHATIDLTGIDILALIGQDVALRKVATTNGGEHAGPCPFCGGDDRFRVWPHDGDRGRYWCRQCEAQGDAIDYIRKRRSYTFAEALEALRLPTSPGARPVATPRAPDTGPRLSPPAPSWQERARAFVATCEAALWDGRHPEALALLHGRGLRDDTIREARLGLNVATFYEAPEAWGLDREHKRVWLPRGIVIPWEIGGELWRVNIRRPAGDLRDADDPKYIGPARGAGHSGLYGADRLQMDRPAMIVEGEIDALTVLQAAGDLVAPVATGSTSEAHRPAWIAKLALASVVLVAFDADEPGDKAAAYWLSILDNAKRWRPYWGKDANEFAQGGADLRAWVEAGLPGQEVAAEVATVELRPALVATVDRGPFWEDPATAGDPRPDLERDSANWARLLGLAWRTCSDLWEPLRGLRCLGAQLYQGPLGWRIASDDEDYPQDRERYLLPRRDELAELLGKIDPPDPERG